MKVENIECVLFVKIQLVVITFLTKPVLLLNYRQFRIALELLFLLFLFRFGVNLNKLLQIILIFHFFSFNVFFLAVTFAEFWKRKSAELSYLWNVIDYEVEVEKPRPSFSARASSHLPNPITGVLEPYFSPLKRAERMLAGLTLIIFMVKFKHC